MKQYIVGVTLGTDVHSVNVKINWRRSHLLGVDRDLFALRCVCRIVVVSDRQAGQRIVHVDDERLTWKSLKRRGRVKIVARYLPIGRRAANDAICENEEVLHWRSDRVQPCVSLMRSEHHLQNTVLAREHNRLTKVRPNGYIRVDNRTLC